MRTVCIAVLAIALQGCAQWITPATPPTEALAGRRETVRVRRDADETRLFAAAVVGDSLVGYSSPGRRDGERQAIALGDIRELRIHRVNWARTAALGAATAATAIATFIVLHPTGETLYGARPAR